MLVVFFAAVRSLLAIHWWVTQTSVVVADFLGSSGDVEEGLAFKVRFVPAELHALYSLLFCHLVIHVLLVSKLFKCHLLSDL